MSSPQQKAPGFLLFPIVPRLPRPPLEVESPVQGSREAAGPELSASLRAGCPCTPCQPERCHLPADSRGYSHNRNNAPQQACKAANPPRESKRTDATRYIYLSISSATDPQAYFQDGVSGQPSCPARNHTTCQRQPPSHGSEAGHKTEVQNPFWRHTHPTPRGPAQGSNDPGDPVTWAASHQEQPQLSDTSQHKAFVSEGTGAVGCCS